MMKSQHILATLALLFTGTTAFTASTANSHSSRSTTRQRTQQQQLSPLAAAAAVNSPLWSKLETEDSSCDDDDTSSSSSEPLSQANGALPTVIQQIVDERAAFNMNLGKAMDTLRTDMPEILRTSPDFSIYHPDISVIDPSGVRVKGLDNYQSAIAFFQTFIKFWFSSTSRLQYRMVYDFCRSSIRVSWNMILIPKVPLGRPLFLDGVSHYKLDASSGKIMEHKIENLVMNDTPVAPPYGIFSLLQQQQDVLGQQRQRVPVGMGV